MQGLIGGPGVPTMPAPLAGGGWSLLPLEAAQATSWLREILRNLHPTVPPNLLGTHSLKASLLSMMSKAGCDPAIRRLAGYHVDPGSRMALEYSRDAQAPVLHALQAVCMAVQNGFFDPDASRSRRWPRRNCNMSKMDAEQGWYQSHNEAPEEPHTDDTELGGWDFVADGSDAYSPTELADDMDDEIDSMSSISDPADRPVFNAEDFLTSGEEQEAEVAAPIVGEALARDLESIIHVRVFKHVISGCCHVAKSANTDPDDGDCIVLKCGKLASKNFEEVELAGNEYKCSRCFAGQ